MISFLLWALLFVICWPLAILALVLWPIVWLISLPFRLARHRRRRRVRIVAGRHFAAGQGFWRRGVALTIKALRLQRPSLSLLEWGQAPKTEPVPHF
jgi:hypothetical protein